MTAKVPEKYKDLITQDQLDSWWSEAADNYIERMEDPSDEDIETWANFCVEERLRQKFD